MSKWKECKLGDIAVLYNNSWKVGDEEFPYIALEHIGEGSLRLNGFDHSSVVISNKYRFDENNFLFGKLRPYFRKVVIPKFKGICSTDIWVIGSYNNTDLNFLFYLFANREFVDLAYLGSSGTKMPRADWKFMKDTEWIIPQNIVEQKAIASVLSSLDDKIDLLHRQNKTLEAMAETLFRQWFIEEAEDDWKWVELGSFIEVMRGLSYKGSGLCLKNNGIPMHNLNSVYEGGGYKYEGIKYYSGDYKERHLIVPGDIIITNTEQGHDLLLIGFPAIIPKFYGNSGIFSQHIYKLNIKDKYLTTPFIYYLIMSHDVREQITGSTNGSTVNMLPKNGIEWAKFKLPPKKKINEFSLIVKQYLEKKEIIYNSINTLEKLRDTLLPKLMSGEIRVKY